MGADLHGVVEVLDAEPGEWIGLGPLPWLDCHINRNSKRWERLAWCVDDNDDWPPYDTHAALYRSGNFPCPLGAHRCKAALPNDASALARFSLDGDQCGRLSWLPTNDFVRVCVETETAHDRRLRERLDLVGSARDRSYYVGREYHVDLIFHASRVIFWLDQ